MHSVSNSHRWRRALSHQLQRRAAGCSRQRLRSVPSTVTHGPRARGTSAHGQCRRRGWASWPLQWSRHSTVLASLHRPTRPTDPVERSSRARHSTDPVPARVSGARIRRQGAGRAGSACCRRACSTRARAPACGLAHCMAVATECCDGGDGRVRPSVPRPTRSVLSPEARPRARVWRRQFCRSD